MPFSSIKMVSLAVCLTAALAALIAAPSDAFAPQTSIFRSHRDASGKLSMIDPAAHVDLIHSTASLLPSLSLSDAVLETAATASSAVDAVSQSGIDTPDLASAASSMPNAGGVGYSKASYYTTLGLYVMSFPGIWSQIKRSTSAKVKRKTLVGGAAGRPNDVADVKPQKLVGPAVGVEGKEAPRCRNRQACVQETRRQQEHSLVRRRVTGDVRLFASEAAERLLRQWEGA